MALRLGLRGLQRGSSLARLLSETRGVRNIKDDIDLGTAWDYVPTLSFGLGAVFLARRPQGVLFDVMNRIRLRQMRRDALLAEAAASSGTAT